MPQHLSRLPLRNGKGSYPKDVLQSGRPSGAGRLASLLCFLGVAVQIALPSLAQQPKADTAVTLAEVTATRDAFIGRIHAMGLSCPIAPPRIVVEDVPSFGQYDDTNNTLRTTDWSLLGPREIDFAHKIAPPGADEASVRATFQDVAHRWIFVHELGHWWQACQKAGVSAGRQPYAIEYEADRIAMAYWNGTDASLPAKMVVIAQSVLDHAPNPVPDGQVVETYFNANYQTLGPSPAYPWFQAQMIVASGKELPKPTFAQALVLGKR